MNIKQGTPLTHEGIPIDYLKDDLIKSLSKDLKKQSTKRRSNVHQNFDGINDGEGKGFKTSTNFTTDPYLIS